MGDTSAPSAFLSYERFADEQESGHITALFQQRLSEKVRLLTGEPFKIFVDREQIDWGHNWRDVIAAALNHVTFLIPIIIPGFFRSEHCRYELQELLSCERTSELTNLVFPVYYLDCDEIDNEGGSPDDLAAAIRARQYIDWRRPRAVFLQTTRESPANSKRWPNGLRRP